MTKKTKKVKIKYSEKKQSLFFLLIVLPKYEVTIESPPFVARVGEKNITATVCARWVKSSIVLVSPLTYLYYDGIVCLLY